jgi:hypothetical protein
MARTFDTRPKRQKIARQRLVNMLSVGLIQPLLKQCKRRKVLERDWGWVQVETESP